MDISLFGQSLLVTLCLISFGILTYLISKIQPKLWAELLGVGLLIGLIVQIIIAETFHSASELPFLFVLMVLPFSLSLYIPVSLFRTRKHLYKVRKLTKKKLKKSRPVYAVAFVAMISSLLLSLALFNGYYKYYPTLDSLIQSDNAEAATLSSNGQIVLQYNNTSTKQNNNKTLESLVYGNNSSSTNGKLYSLNIPGKVSKFHARSGWVYVPAIASNDDNTLNLPVLVLIAGFPGAPTDWLHGVDLVNTMDTFAKAHHGITPMVFVVDDTGNQFNDTECVNSPRGNVETYLTQDVPNYIKDHFPVSNNSVNWGIGGISMGGMCSVMLSLLHPNVYHYFIDIGGNNGPEVGDESDTTRLLFNNSKQQWAAHQPYLLLNNKSYPGLGGFFASGKNDDAQVVEQTRQLYLESKQADMEAVYETVQGQHTFNVFEQIFKDALPWISNRIGATSCSGSTTVCS